MKKFFLAGLILLGMLNASLAMAEVCSDPQTCHKEALAGDARAQTFLGLFYYLGGGVTQDYKEAEKWYRKAANQGNAASQFALGDMYYNGQGVTQDYKEAEKWYRKAADQGDATSQLALGGMYALGQGVTQDFVLAHMWSNLASAGGDKKGGKLRDLVASEMTPSQIEKAQQLARNWKPKAE